MSKKRRNKKINPVRLTIIIIIMDARKLSTNAKPKERKQLSHLNFCRKKQKRKKLLTISFILLALICLTGACE